MNKKAGDMTAGEYLDAITRERIDRVKKAHDIAPESAYWPVATPASILAAEDGGNTYSPPDWADLRKSFVSMMAKIDLRFRSGNSIQADRAHITAEEWALMGRYEEACEDLITTVLSNANSQAGGREVSEEDAYKMQDLSRRHSMLSALRIAFPNGVAQGDSNGQ